MPPREKELPKYPRNTPVLSFGAKTAINFIVATKVNPVPIPVMTRPKMAEPK
jgi:hypothetical protein